MTFNDIYYSVIRGVDVMCEINYFIKLLMLLTNDNDFLLLYGFCSSTSQDTYDWKEYVGNKGNRYIWKAILKEDECKAFIKKLKEPGEILINKNKFTSPSLLERSIVLSNDSLNKKAGPIKEYRQVTEFWNTNKKYLYNKVIREFEKKGIDGKEQYDAIIEMFDWVKEESGINIIDNGYRLGNFEFYHPSQNKYKFIIESHKELGLLKTTVKKIYDFKNNLIVNCTAKCRERTISNQTKIFLPEESVMEFTALEQMAQVVIQIWDEESGDLIFSDDYTLIMKIKFNMDLITSSNKVSDPWTKKMIESASNKKEDIENKVEKVTYSTQIDSFSINSNFENEIDLAIEEGCNIFSYSQKSYEAGTFIKNVQKDGEIQSFIKILEYINCSTVKDVIIVDPFFSTTAASKILGRISNRDVHIKVITSLCEINPDNGKVEKTSQSDILQEFLEKNKHVLHSKLLVLNLKRGGKQVFHDRYLIRYHKNGRIDGFLLSNSLNSMGQFYPFIIVPMDYELCLEVKEYINEICVSDVQKKKNKKNRIITEILYDGEKFCNYKTNKRSEELIYRDWFAKWKNTEGIVKIPKEDVLEAFSIIMKVWVNDSKLACKMICYMGTVVELHTSFELMSSLIKNQVSLVNSFVEEFICLAKYVEVETAHCEKGMESEEYRFFMLLNGNAQPSRLGFSKIIEEAGHIFYGPVWLRAGYNILLELAPKRYIDLLELTKSPLMFDILLEHLYWHSSLDEWFSSFMEKDNLCVRLACTDSILQKVKSEEFSVEKVKEIMTHMSIEKRIIPEIRLISETTFYIRTKQNINQDKCNKLLKYLMILVSEDIIVLSEELQNTALYWLYDCEVVSNSKLHFKLANLISNSTLKKKLLEEALNSVEEDLRNCSYCKDIVEIGELYIVLLKSLYGDEIERQLLKRYIDWSTFEIATEPELKNYSYDKWHSAAVKAVRQLEILFIYQETYPESHKLKEYIGIWGNRLLNSDIKNILTDDMYEGLLEKVKYYSLK